MSRARWSVAAAALSLVVAQATASADDLSALRSRAESLASSGRCEEALEVIAKAGAPDDAKLALLAGQCQIRLKRYADAESSLEHARDLDPNLPHVDLSLGIARYHAGDFDGAREALAAARAKGESSAELDLYDGLLLLQRADAKDAALALDRARISDPGVEPVASFYSGLAWSSVDDRTHARESLQRVIQEAPGTPWAEAAQRALKDIDNRSPRKWLRMSVGAEYDTNVALLGYGVVLPQGISHQGDVRAVWWADAGAEVFRTENWAGGVRAHYYGNAQGTLHQFNEEYPGAGFWLDHRVDERTSMRLEYDYGYAWVGGADPYLSGNTATFSVIRNWGEPGTTVVSTEAVWNNYFFPLTQIPVQGSPGANCMIECAPVGLNTASSLDADGFGATTGFDHAIPLGWNGTIVNAGYRYQFYNSEGSEWKFSGHELHLGVHTDLPFEVRLYVWGTYTYRPFENPSVFPNSSALRQAQIQNTAYQQNPFNRRDNVYQVEVGLERKITDWLSVSVRYNYLDNDSNTDVYRYTRQIVGGYLTLYLHD
ncbi:MAG TPA: CDC27 family protein [Myxococcota bacterium]|nr:CDC27 family protein [Myxococcota bacterium]